MRECNAGAAPATVSGEPTSIDVTEANDGLGKTGEGKNPRARRPAMANIVHGRGVPVCRSKGYKEPVHAMRPLTHAPSFSG